MIAQFNSAELNMLRVLLEELREKQSNAGCNDFSIEKTPETMLFAEMFNNTQPNEDLAMCTDGKKIFGMDLDVTQYFLNKIEKLSSK